MPQTHAAVYPLFFILLPFPGPIRFPGNGFRVGNAGKRLKSRSAVQNSVTPCARQTAATRASWIIAPLTRPLRSRGGSSCQWSPVSASNSATGDSSQVSTWVMAAFRLVGGLYMRGWVTTARNSCTQGHGRPQVTRPSANNANDDLACSCHSESDRCAYTRIFVSVAINRHALRKWPRGCGASQRPETRAASRVRPHSHPSA